MNGFEKEVRKSPYWRKVAHSAPGAIGILERKVHLDGSLGTRHTFTCIGGGRAVHNDPNPKIRSPQEIAISDFVHHTGGLRVVEAYYLHVKLIQQI